MRLTFLSILILFISQPGWALLLGCGGDKSGQIRGAKALVNRIALDSNDQDVSAEVTALKSIIDGCQLTYKDIGVDPTQISSWQYNGYQNSFNAAKKRLEEGALPNNGDMLYLKSIGPKLGLGADQVETYVENRVAREIRACGSSVTDLRNSDLGEVRDQGTVGWCYAFAAADLLGYRMHKKISAMDIGITYSHSASYNRNHGVASPIESNLAGGVVPDAVEEATKHGLCLENQLPARDELCPNPADSSTPMNCWDEASMLDAAQSLKSKTMSSVQFDRECNYASHLFAGVRDITSIVNQSSANDIVPKLADEACKPRIQTTVPTPQREDGPPAQLFATIDDQLNHQNISAITIDPKFLNDRTGKTDAHNYGNSLHEVVVVGRKWDGINGCQYLLRNSWGRSCAQYDSSYACEAGNIWVPKNVLYQATKDVTYIPQ